MRRRRSIPTPVHAGFIYRPRRVHAGLMEVIMTEMQIEEARMALYQAQTLVDDLRGCLSGLLQQQAEFEDKISQTQRLIGHLEDDVIPQLQRCLQPVNA